MKTIALLSGGKDSILAVLMAYRYGHEPAVIVNIVPALPGDAGINAAEAAEGHDIDSYMYQTVGFEAVDGIAACLQVPLRRAVVKRGRAKDQSLLYSEHPPEEDEVESLYRLLKEVKEEFPEVQGLTSGAILSNYQRNRVEFICDRLGIESLAYLWMRQPSEILDMAHDLAVRAILVKTASIGLMPRQLIGKTLEEARPTLEKMTALYQSHLAGEGGEYETTVLNCPLFREEQLVVSSLDVIMQDDNDISPSGHGVLTVQREAKSAEQQATDALLLHELRDGRLHFPSDVLPLLQSLVRPKVRLTLSDKPCQPAGSECTMYSLFASAERPGLTSHTIYREISTDASSSTGAADITTPAASSTGAVYEAIYDCVWGCVVEAQAWAQAEGVTPFYYHLSLPSMSWAAAAHAAYTATVSHVCPPGLLVTARSPALPDDVWDPAWGSNSSTAVLEVLLHTPRAAVQENVLHAQSRSCWAVGQPGPYAQGRRVALADEESLVWISATAGRVPATRAVATPADLPEACREEVDTFLQVESARQEKKQGEDFNHSAAEFLFALANCAQYLALYRHTLEDVTRATFFVTDNAPTWFLPSLWEWCVDASAPSFAEVCTVATVAALGEGEQYRVLLECVEKIEE